MKLKILCNLYGWQIQKKLLVIPPPTTYGLNSKG